jgi:hypothetical protein
VRPRWIVTDLDGTLVDRNLAMVARSREALLRFVAAGGEVVIATGRSLASMRPYYDELGLHGPAILLNGAQVVDPRTGDVLLDRRFPAADWTRIRAFLERLPAGAADPVGYVGDRAFQVGVSPLVEEYAARDRVHVEVVSGWASIPVPVSKVLIACAGPAEAAAVARLATAAKLPVTLVASENTYVELLPAGSDKGAALRWLAAYRGVLLAEVAAIGDNPNDIPMIREAGLGVAVQDGHPAVREAASLVVGSCAGGAVADLVELTESRV